MGQNVVYTELVAYMGQAFAQRWDNGGWNIAANDPRFMYDEPLKAYELGFNGAGRNVKISVKEDEIKSIVKEDAFSLIKFELDCGRPVIALGVVGPPEAAIITGYQGNGDKLLGWSLFQDDWGGCEFDETGYFIKKDWWTETETIMAVAEATTDIMSDVDVLRNGLMLMTTDEIKPYNGGDLFFGGQKAYETWAKMLESDDYLNGMRPGDFGACHRDQEGMLRNREYAAKYMELLAEKHPDLTIQFSKCAQLLKAAADCVPQMEQLREGHRFSVIFAEKQHRKQIAELIRQAAKYEEEACVVLAEIIAKM